MLTICLCIKCVFPWACKTERWFLHESLVFWSLGYSYPHGVRLILLIVVLVLQNSCYPVTLKFCSKSSCFVCGQRQRSLIALAHQSHYLKQEASYKTIRQEDVVFIQQHFGNLFLKRTTNYACKWEKQFLHPNIIITKHFYYSSQWFG